MRKEFQHPLWEKYGEAADGTGHDEENFSFKGSMTLMRLGRLMQNMNVDEESVKNGADTYNNVLFNGYAFYFCVSLYLVKCFVNAINQSVVHRVEAGRTVQGDGSNVVFYSIQYSVFH